jgi:hypothetical protein
LLDVVFPPSGTVPCGAVRDGYAGHNLIAKRDRRS